MPNPTVIHSTFVIERNYPAPLERVYAAFTDPEKKVRWFAQGGQTEVEKFEMDFRAGGTERTSWRFREGSRFPGVALVNEGVYQDIVPNKRIVMASNMTIGDHRMSASLMTFEFLLTESGTDLIVTHQGAFFEGSDGPQMREEGWRKIIERLDAELAR